MNIDAPSRWTKLAALQHRRAGSFALVALLISIGSVFFVRDLGLDSRFTALLPESAASVQDLEEIGHRVRGLSTLTIAIESPSKNREALQSFARDLVQRLDAMPENVVGSVDWNIGTYADFVYDHRHLYADLSDLEEVESELEARIEYERAQANPFYVDLEEEEPPDPAALVERLQRKAEEGRERLERFPGGFYLHEDGDLLVVFVRTDLSGGDSVGSAGLLREVGETIEALDPSSYGEDLTTSFAGDVVVALEEQRAIARELIVATVLTILIVLLAIYAFFRRARSIVLLGSALIPPVLFTFAFAELSVDFLNTSTAFLGSIVIGNGVNPNIIWLARYFEQRRLGNDAVKAMAETHRSVWLGTLTASVAAALAYGSLMLTDFRGFRDFGAIGLVGMLACWLSATLLLPALAAGFERFRPMNARHDVERISGLARFFTRVVYASPKLVVVFSVLVTFASVGAMGYALDQGAMEYDFRKLKSEREGTTTARSINARVHEMVGSSAQGNGIAIVVDSPLEAEDLEAALEAEAGEADPDAPLEGALWLNVHTLNDLLPGDAELQQQKRALLGLIRTHLQELRPRTDEATQANIDEHLPPEDIQVLTREDLPESVAGSFTERDGTRGRILVVEANQSIWDGEYLVAWSKGLRAVHLDREGATRPRLAGRAPVFADVIQAVVNDGPTAIFWAFLATFILSLVAFRKLRERLLTMLALVLGIAWMGGTMAALGMKLNFLNFVAFPITFGNGVDYGVNVMRRYSQECELGRRDPVRASVEQTGGAVILCSLTTVIGYSSLYSSANLAINSFGLAMAISEVTCLLSAVLTMPAILLLLAKRAERRRPDILGGTAPKPRP